MVRYIVFVTLTFATHVHCANSLSIPSKALVNHIDLLKELKRGFAKKTPDVPPQSPSQMTQTEAHMTRYKTEINASFDLKKHQKLIDEIMTKERSMASSHYVFYHAQQHHLRVVQDFVKELYEFAHLQGKENFTFLRLWYESFAMVDAHRFINKEEGSDIGKNWHDHSDHLKKNMLCVNLSLFGNQSHWGECTWRYFINNSSIGMPSIHDLFKRCGIKDSYIQQLIKLGDSIKTSEGTLFQIFIPKQNVDRCVYLSHAYGTPYRYPIVSNIFDTYKKRHTAIAPILDLYMRNPSAISDMDKLQARILFSQDMMLNPDMVKIIRYTTVPEGKMKKYYAELKKITRALFEEWLSQPSDMLKHDAAKGTPLACLLSYLKK